MQRARFVTSDRACCVDGRETVDSEGRGCGGPGVATKQTRDAPRGQSIPTQHIHRGRVS